METKILKYKYFLYGILGVVLVFGAGLNGCKKKSRLDTNTVNFSITPPAATFLQSSTSTITLFLTAKETSPGGGNVDVNPNWSVSGAGTCSDSNLNCTNPNLNVTFGPTVKFTDGPNPQLGDVIITATANGMTATSRIAIVNFIPPTMPTGNIFNIYTDLGLPVSIPGQTATNIFSFPSPAPFTLKEVSGEYTPEGNKFQRTTGLNGAAGFDGTGGWGVTFDLDKNLVAHGYFFDLSPYSTGNLVFSIKQNSGTGTIAFEVKSKDGGIGRYSLPSGDYTSWTEVSVPFSALQIVTIPIDFSQIVVPWDVSVTGASNLSFDIDAIRWQK